MARFLTLGELTWAWSISTKWNYSSKCILDILVSHHVAARNRSYFGWFKVERTLSQVYSRNLENLMVRNIARIAGSPKRKCSFSGRLLRILESSIIIFLCTSVSLSSLQINFFHILGIRMFTLLLIKVRFLAFLFLWLWSVIYSVSDTSSPKCPASGFETEKCWV